MKIKLLLLFKGIIMYSFYGFLTQILICTAVLATEVSVAQNTSVKETHISFNFNSKSLETVFREIEEKTNFTFVYTAKEIDQQIKINGRYNNAPVYEVLLDISKKTNLAFRQYNQNITVKKLADHEPYNDHASVQVLADMEISGKITDENGEGLPGASVIEKGTTNGTTTDLNGNYKLSLAEDATVVISFVGYKTYEVLVSSRSVIDVQMQLDAEQLEDVIVVGYGVKRKREVTGAISSIDSKQIKEQYVTSFDQALAGRVAGVQVLQSSGSPGGSISIRVRGIGTPGVSEPLYVIDGIPVFNDNNGKSSIGRGQPNNVLNTINPNDIQSIEVLKDAASAAIYGSRAANGVVIITTKQGKVGAPKLNLDYSYGVQSLPRKIDVLDGPTYDEFVHEFNALDTNPNNDGAFTNPANTDWQDELFRTAGTHNLNMSIGGGNDYSTYLLSTGYMKQDGILRGTDFERFSLRLNSAHQISNKLKIGNNMTVSRVLTGNTAQNNIFNASIPLGTITPPIIPAYGPDGSYGGPGTVGAFYQRHNPLILALENQNKDEMFRFLGNIYAEYELFEGLKYRINAGGDFIYGGTTSFSPTLITPGSIDQTAGAGKFDGKEFIWLLENTLNYKKELGGGHNLGVLVGATQQKSSATTHFSGKTDFPVNTLKALDAGNSITNVGGAITDWSLASFIGRFDYNFKGKYILTASIRRDGSSRFGPGNKWGTFPSVSAGWMLSDESFFDVGVISQLKLRASWGKLGNQEIAPFQYLPLLTNNAQYTFGGQLVPGLYAAQPANEAISWETSRQFDVGLDLNMFEDRLTFSFDYYDKLTEGILLSSTLPLSYGFLSDRTPQFPTINAGVVSNKGMEFDLTYRGGSGDFTWSASANLATLSNEVTSLGTGGALVNQNEGYSTRTDVGMAIGSFYGYTVEGVFQNQADIDGHATQPGAQPGDFKFLDLDNNGTIDSDDQQVLGSPIPSLTYGLNFGANYKKFDFSIMLQGVSGNEIYNSVMQQAGDFTKPDNKFTRLYENRWTGDGSGNSVPALSQTNANDNYRNSDYFIHDGSFLRLRSLQIGYTIINGDDNINGVGRVRIYIGGQNLATFDNYDFGHDPEIGAVNQNNNLSGIDFGRYPSPRTVTVGINATF